ncbi:topoisomerase-4 subunit B [Cohaesibacter marisflavi]|uniref:DNA topoisomerase 4 subunit B n=1 Tax=Cohaesibacter marisflavi TaxID=655353 RepID=A0A1I5FQR9_9HYPH|nr:DNA topoisomerase IV subunit B [Cohaesibacter marisflavi]SFO26102.1 topoisomerase-4 subunit B [Cohaesibacter marisflavi]
MSASDDLFASVPTPKGGTPAPKAAPAAPATPKPKSGNNSPASVPGVKADYTAADIEVLEGLEPVRRRPGMYIGGTDEKALHHLFAEIIDNSMDEAVAGYASWIEVELLPDNVITVTDNGRGIPVDPHPKFPNKSALEVILTTLHAGGKFDSAVYETSGGLHGVGASVVNALSESMVVEVASNKKLYRQSFSRGIPTGALELLGDVHNRRGTKVTFKPDHEIFGKKLRFKPEQLLNMARSKAYLFGGVEIRWSCAPELLEHSPEVPPKATFHFPEGLKDYLAATLGKTNLVTQEIFAGRTEKSAGHGAVEWAVCWFGGDGFFNSYCNTVPTPEGGTHESGLRTALLRGLKNYAELTSNKKGTLITADDVMTSAGALLSVFIREPEFVGQTKDRLATTAATRIVEQAVRDQFDHWLTNAPQQANRLLDWVIDRAEERLRRRKEKDVSRKSAVRKLRLPGKLADCSQNAKGDTELFIVEGDSAGGSAKQARNRTTQAVLPLRGKILNVASASSDKLHANQLLADLVQALGCGTRKNYNDDDLRYDRVIIMTDADVDGAHIASLLLTYFQREMPQLIHNGHLFLAIPPLYRISQGGKTLYARDDMHKDELLDKEFKGKGKIEIGRFKGLGEMRSDQLKDTTMDPKNRTLLKVQIVDMIPGQTKEVVTRLMGNKPEARFEFIQENAEFATDLDI